MAPTLMRPPFLRDGWIYEEKVDGWRMLAYRDGSRVRHVSRRAVDHTTRFRDVAAAIAKIPADIVVLDGEVAVYDEKLVSRFHLLGDDESGVLCMPPEGFVVGGIPSVDAFDGMLVGEVVGDRLG